MRPMLGKRRQRCLRKQWRNDNRGIFRTHGAGACTVGRGLQSE